MPNPESQLLDAARVFLLCQKGGGRRLLQIVLAYECLEGIRSTLTLEQGQAFPDVEAAAEGEPDVQTVAPALTPTMRLILDVLAAASVPLKGAAIANRAGKRYGGGIRSVLGQMVRAGLIVKLEGGYWLASRPPASP